MLSPTLGLLRGLRAVSLGVAGFVLALVAHVVAGRAAPGPVVLVLLAGVSGLAAVLLTGVRLSPIRVGLSLVAMQGVLHEAFMWLGGPAGCSMTGMSTPAPGHLGHGGQPVLACVTGMAQTGMAQHSLFASTAMVGAHVAATALLAAMLAYGEKALWLLAGWMRPPRWLGMRPPELPPVRVVIARAPQMLWVRYALGGVGRRGPPPRGLSAID
jgi:hypothetical protein